MTDEKNKLIDKLRDRIRELEADLASVVVKIPPEKPLNARERDSLLSMIAGMAVVGYGYDPNAPRSKQPSEIASDLANAGVPLDVDTVRKWLSEAAGLLPPRETE